MNDPTDDRIDAIAAAIRDYLERFPNARDTARGIQEWWLPPSLRDRPFVEVQRALWRLVGRGQVVALSLSNTTTLFAKAPPSPDPSRRSS